VTFRGWVNRDAALARSQVVASYLGGMRLGYSGIASWSYPLVKLTFYPDGVEVGPAAGFLRVAVPFWRALYGEIDSITILECGRARGLRFTTKDGAFVIFASFRVEPIIRTLNELDLEVDPVPRPFRYFKPRA